MGLELNSRKVMVIARKEFMDNVRNMWVLTLSAIFLVLTIVISYFGAAASGGGVGFHGFRDTVAGMSTIAAILLPIIAIMLGYGAIISERENGSLGIVLGCPVSRLDLVVGKFAGLGAVMLVTISIGFGASGLIVGAIAGFSGGLAYALFMLLTFLFCMFFLGFAILMSTLAGRRSTAIAGGLAIWFCGVIAGTILLGIWTATGGDFHAMLNAALSGEMPTMPTWFWVGEYFNFNDIYPMGASNLFGVNEFFGYKFEYPWFINAPMIFAWFAFLLCLTFLGSVMAIRRKDF